MAGLSGAAPRSCVLEVSNITNIALAFGFTIFVLVYATAAYTGQPCGTPITIGSCRSLRILDFQNIAKFTVGHDPRPLASAPCNIPPGFPASLGQHDAIALYRCKYCLLPSMG